MIGWPHFVQGTVLNGGMFPGMNAVLSHHPHLIIRNCSLMICETNLAPRANPTTIFLRENFYPQISQIFADEIKICVNRRNLRIQNQFDKRRETVFLFRSV
jgi:hypothetical protein